MRTKNVFNQTMFWLTVLLDPRLAARLGMHAKLKLGVAEVIIFAEGLRDLSVDWSMCQFDLVWRAYKVHFHSQVKTTATLTWTCWANRFLDCTLALEIMDRLDWYHIVSCKAVGSRCLVHAGDFSPLVFFCSFFFRILIWTYFGAPWNYDNWQKKNNNFHVIFK